MNKSIPPDGINRYRVPPYFPIFLQKSPVYIYIHIYLFIHSFIHSFWRLIQRLFKRLLLRGAPSSVTDKKKTSERCQIWKGGPSARNEAQRGDHSMLMDPQPKKPFAA